MLRMHLTRRMNVKKRSGEELSGKTQERMRGADLEIVSI